MRWLLLVIALISVSYRNPSEEIFIGYTTIEIVVYPEKPDEKEILLLARLIQSEAMEESFEGQLAVGQVVINRAKRKKKTLSQVIHSSGQFDGIGNKWFHRKPAESCIKAARHVLMGRKVLPTTVEFYHNPRTATDKKWRNYIEQFTYVDIGNHRFCYNPDLL